MSVNIFVGNLPYDIDDYKLKQIFEAYGEVNAAYMVRTRETGKSKGFGYAEMENWDEAQDAITALHGKELYGQALYVNEADARELGLMGEEGDNNEGVSL